MRPEGRGRRSSRGKTSTRQRRTGRSRPEARRIWCAGRGSARPMQCSVAVMVLLPKVRGRMQQPCTRDHAVRATTRFFGCSTVPGLARGASCAWAGPMAFAAACVSILNACAMSESLSPRSTPFPRAAGAGRGGAPVWRARSGGTLVCPPTSEPQRRRSLWQPRGYRCGPDSGVATSFSSIAHAPTLRH